VFRSRAVPPWSVRCARGLDCRRLGSNHHRPLLTAGFVPGGQGHPQLHSSRCWWSVRSRSVILDGQRQALVQGTCNKFGSIGWCGFFFVYGETGGWCGIVRVILVYNALRDAQPQPLQVISGCPAIYTDVNL
jgi:hypothetical protein